jgi:hypothetical protein
MTSSTSIRCQCGTVHLQVSRTPIASVECCCTSCRTAGAFLARLPGAPPVLGPHGTTRFELYRKDRVHFVSGMDQLKEYRLSSKASTRRVVAGCCHTPMFLEFKGGHWLSLYSGLWPQATLPPLQMRTMASDLDDASGLPKDVPNCRYQSLGFFARLLGAWIAMGFRVPNIPIKGALDASQHR